MSNYLNLAQERVLLINFIFVFLNPLAYNNCNF